MIAARIVSYIVEYTARAGIVDMSIAGLAVRYIHRYPRTMGIRADHPLRSTAKWPTGATPMVLNY